MIVTINASTSTYFVLRPAKVNLTNVRCHQSPLSIRLIGQIRTAILEFGDRVSH